MAISEEQSRQIAVHAGEVGELEIGVTPIELDPAAVSGQPSASTLSRIQLAKREAALRDPGPLRPALIPAATAGSRPWLPSRPASRIMSAGSFWPSPSMVAMTGKWAARTPVLSAALCPPRRPCRK
jgi:hypothetical protein